MYGLVNQGVKDLVIQVAGEKVWLDLCRENNCPTDFISMQQYDDAITYGLVASASRALNLPAEKILGEFGKFWIKYTAKEGYGPIMDLFGHDFKSCLQNLNQLHARMGMTMPLFKPPHFDFHEEKENFYRITYTSKRKGLSPMVVGLLEGLAEKFSVQIRIIDQVPCENGSVQFYVEVKDAA